jgi:iron(III) transport system permease protein
MPNSLWQRFRIWLTPGRFWTIVSAVLIFYFLIWPMATLAIGAVRTSPFGAKGTWTLQGIYRVIEDPRTLKVLWASTIHSTSATVMSMGLGLFFAVVATRMETRMRWFVTPMMVILLATPRLFYAMAWSMLGNPNSGLMAAAAGLVGIDKLPEWATVYSWAGLIGVTGLKLVGFSYLLLYGPVSRIDRSQEDAAVMSGVPRHRAFFDVTLASITPAMIATGMFIFVENFRLFDIPAVIGLPAGIHTLPLQVNDYLSENLDPNWSAASAISFAVVMIIAALIYMQTSMLKGREFTTMTGKATPPVPVRVGHWAIWVDAFIVLFFLVAIVLPVVQIVLGSFQPFFGLYGKYTLNNFVEALNDKGPWIMAVTFLIAFFGGGIAVMSSFGLALVMQRRPGTFLARMARLGSWVPIFAPGIVLSLALLWAYLNTPGIRLLFGTPWLMFFALIVGSIPVATRTVEGIVHQVGAEVEEAARICGAGVLSAVRQITARLCSPSLLVAWLIVLLGISGTLDIPLLFQSLEAQTVATHAFYLMNYGYVPQAAALFVLYLALLVTGIGSVVLVGWLIRLAFIGRRRAKMALYERAAMEGVLNAAE